MKIILLLRPEITAIICIMILSGCIQRPAGNMDRNINYDLDKDIILIVNGDDVGIAKIYTDATIDAYKKGMISSASIVPCGHDAERAMSILKTLPDLSIGVHLSLTGNWKPLTSRETVPSLYSDQGTMWSTDEQVIQNVKPEHAKIEWDAQIKKVLDSGLKVSHLDSHMGCYMLSAGLYTAVHDLAEKHNIPVMAPYIPGYMPPERMKNIILRDYTGIYRLGALDETLENRTNVYFSKFAGFSPGIYYIFTHQGWVPDDGVISGDMDLRINEYRFWTDIANRKKLEERGFYIMGFSEIHKVFGDIFNLKSRS